jgi:hypothetical protein
MHISLASGIRFFAIAQEIISLLPQFVPSLSLNQNVISFIKVG